MNSRILQVLAVLATASSASAQATPTPIGAGTVNTNPYYYAGRLPFLKAGASKQGSATVIRPYSVLTAGHCLYATTGWSTNVRFERARYNSAYASLSYANRLWVLGGYTSAVNTYGTASSQAFNRDLGGVICTTRPAGGGYAGRWANAALLTGNLYKMSLGYGSAVHNGLEQLRSASYGAFYQNYGAWYKTNYYGIEGGMSGGPVFVWTGSVWYVAAVNVSGPTGVISYGGGVRRLDSDAETLIASYLY